MPVHTAAIKTPINRTAAPAIAVATHFSADFKVFSLRKSLQDRRDPAQILDKTLDFSMAGLLVRGP